MDKDANREYKDTVFKMIFKQPENALSLYNAVNGSVYDDADMLEINTLENAVYMNIKNDISFLMMNQINLYEHQSTYTPNMPLRDLLYVSALIQKHVMTQSLYSRKRIMLPNPRFIVFYNGVEEMPEVTEHRLSDSFCRQEEQPGLELKVTILNINQGMNEELKNKCSMLGEYMIYVGKVREYAKEMSLKSAVEKAVDECIHENVLKEFLTVQKAEAIKMSIYEYDEERELRIIREDERAMGEEIGRNEGINAVVEILRELNMPEKVMIEKIIDKFGLSYEKAEEYLTGKCSVAMR